jgi:glycine cleavage system H protein
MNIPDDLKYSKEHEWVRVDGNVASVGITDHAQSSLGDIVYVELPDEGDALTKDETFGVVESVKAVSDCYAPVSGKIVEVNTHLGDSPETLNEDCYGEGWILKVELDDPSELDDLMTPKQYEAFVTEETA